MKKTIFVLAILLCSVYSFSQEKQSSRNSMPDRSSLPRSRDHFMIQLSSDNWMGAPDSINSRIKGISRGVNVYVMLDKPFASNPKFSFAFGLGIGTSHIFFKNVDAAINSSSRTLPFSVVDTIDHFKKYKIATAYAELPIELRFYSNPQQLSKSFKFAIGAKLGTLVNAHTKGKTLVNPAGNTIQEYTEKVSSKKFFNTTRLVGTARIGYGPFSFFGTYTITSLFKDNVAADIKPFQIGLTISGL